MQESVRRRVDALSDGARALLPLCAVIGRRFDFALLTALSGSGEEALLGDVKELVEAAIIVEESPDRFAFRHALMREAIHSQLLSRERRAAHARVVDVIGSGAAAETQVEDLAYHAFEAADWKRARVYAAQAGERALALFAPAAAAQDFTRAITAERELGVTTTATSFLGRARALDLMGEFDGARLDLEDALASARAARNTGLEWETTLELGLLWASRDYERSATYYEQALALTRSDGTPEMVARSLNRLGNWLVNADQPLSGARYHAEALRVFESANDDAGVAETCDLLGMANYMGGDLQAGTVYYRRAAALFEQLHDQRGLSSSLASLLLRGATFQLSTVVAAAPLPEVLPDGERALDVAREIDWRSGETYALWQGGLTLAGYGAYGRALDQLQHAIAIAAEIEHRQWSAAARWSLGAILHELLAFERAQRELEQALELATETRSGIWLSHATASIASTLVARGQLEAAATVLDSVQGEDTAIEAIGLRLCWAARAELALASGEAEHAREITTRLIDSSPNVSSGRPIPRLLALRGDALAALGEHAAAEADLLSALATARELGALPLAWRIAASLARLCHVSRRRADAERWAREAEVTIQQLAESVPDPALREQFVRRAAERLPVAAGARRPPAPGGLTPRELEIASLAATGASNRAIATQLVLSERTIETHITNILKKLDFTSRAQVAAWAVAQGLEHSER